jgi:hypothetical protein
MASAPSAAPRRRRPAWLLAAPAFAALALAACSPPTIADACANVCACDPTCGTGSDAGTLADCELNASGLEMLAKQAECQAEFDALVACVYTVSCPKFQSGCVGEQQRLIQCVTEACGTSGNPCH